MKSQIPPLDLTNYRIWSIRMRAYLVSLDLWCMVIHSDESERYHELLQLPNRSKLSEYQRLGSKAAEAFHILLSHISDPVVLMHTDVLHQSSVRSKNNPSPTDPGVLWAKLEKTFLWEKGCSDPRTTSRARALEGLLGLGREGGTLALGENQSVMEYYALHRILYNEYCDLLDGKVDDNKRRAALEEWLEGAKERFTLPTVGKETEIEDLYWDWRNADEEEDTKWSTETKGLISAAKTTAPRIRKTQPESIPKKVPKAPKTSRTPKPQPSTKNQKTEGSVPFTPSISTPSIAESTSERERACTTCGKYGHTTEVCWENPCGVCGRKGHPTKNCWTKKVCDNCGKMGHPTSNCWLVPCDVCGKKGHRSEDCHYAEGNKNGKKNKNNQEKPEPGAAEDKPAWEVPAVDLEDYGW